MTGAAPCFGMFQLFESTDIRDHRAAKSICDTCPLLPACEKNVADMTATAGVHGQPEGTWAGRLYLTKTPGDRPNRNERAKQADLQYDDTQARQAHSRYTHGARDDWSVTGERVYQTRRRRNARKAAVA